MHRERENQSSGLTHTIMEADKSQIYRGVSKLETQDGGWSVPARVQRPEKQTSQWLSSHSEASRLETQGVTVSVQVQRQEKRPVPQCEGSEDGKRAL